MDTQNICLLRIKEIVGKILYIDDLETIKDDSELFNEFDLSSIDYLDLCFELKKAFGKDVKPDEFWPFAAMATNQEYFKDGEWTNAGWLRVCLILDIDPKTNHESVKDLYKRFTVKYIQNRLGKM